METELFDYEEFGRLINSLEENHLRYFVFGGFAIDAINKERTQHEDLDLIIIEDDKMKLINILKNMRYTKKQIGRIIVFRKKTKNQILKIDVMFMKIFKDTYRIRGNRSEEIISKEIFDKDTYLESEGIKFKTMPFEWFSLYQEIKHFNPEKDAKHKRAMESITPFHKNLKILKRRDIKRLKSDPKYNLE